MSHAGLEGVVAHAAVMLLISCNMSCVKPKPASVVAAIGPPNLAMPGMLTAGPVPDRALGTPRLRAGRVLQAELVEELRAKRRHELRARRVLPIVEVVGALHRQDAAADVGGDEVVEEDVAHREPVRLVELVIHLADRELGVLSARLDCGSLRPSADWFAGKIVITLRPERSR